MSAEQQPPARTFEELSGPTRRRCRKCDRPATVRLQLRAQGENPTLAAGGVGGQRRVLARREWDFCQSHGVEVFEQITRVLPGGAA